MLSAVQTNHSKIAQQKRSTRHSRLTYFFQFFLLILYSRPICLRCVLLPVYYIMKVRWRKMLCKDSCRKQNFVFKFFSTLISKSGSNHVSVNSKIYLNRLTFYTVGFMADGIGSWNIRVRSLLGVSFVDGLHRFLFFFLFFYFSFFHLSLLLYF